MTTSDEPRISIVIPIYNEEGILRSAVIELVDRLQTSRPPIPWWQTPLNPPTQGPAPW